MSSAKRRFFSGNTIEQALVQAASYYKIEPARIAYREVEKRHGFVKMRRRVVIQVDPDNPARSDGAPRDVAPRDAARNDVARGDVARGDVARSDVKAAAPTPLAGATPPPPPAAPPWRSPVEERPYEEPARPPAEETAAAELPSWQPRMTPPWESSGTRASDPAPRTAPEEPVVPPTREPAAAVPPSREPAAEVPPPQPPRGAETVAAPMDLLSGAREAAERLVRLSGLDLTVEVTEGKDRELEVNLSGRDRQRLLDEDAEVFQSIEQLLPRVLRGLAGESPSVRVDSDRFRGDQEDGLQRLAQAAAEVLRQGARAVELRAMAPAERRIVHLTLADEPGIATESEGEGYYKRVFIRQAE